MLLLGTGSKQSGGFSVVHNLPFDRGTTIKSVLLTPFAIVTTFQHPHRSLQFRVSRVKPDGHVYNRLFQSKSASPTSKRASGFPAPSYYTFKPP